MLIGLVTDQVLNTDLETVEYISFHKIGQLNW